MVLDSGEKSYGKNNRDVLGDLWPSGKALPELLTWEVPESEKHLKLHAKVLVADRGDALVTSANLTMHALDRNMEMGVRVSGPAGQRIAHHFDLLRVKRVLVPFPV
jgi:phosphatidylserine/phosphatidylglycerophosphate/cardiolipin synthase-like enzyme